MDHVRVGGKLLGLNCKSGFKHFVLFLSSYIFLVLVVLKLFSQVWFPKEFEAYKLMKQNTKSKVVD